MSDTAHQFETLLVHAGMQPDAETGARVPAIYQSASYVFKDTDHAARLFGLEELGFIYSRLTNPTVGRLEEKLAALEGGAGATCTSCGHSAQQLLFFTLLSPGDHFVGASQLYGGSINQFTNSFPRAFDWHCDFADATKPETIKAAIGEKTKAIFIESLANPGGIVVDIAAIAAIADEAGIPLIVDNTMATAALCKPFEHGAHIVTYSTTKFMSGHGSAMGGAIVDSGKFNWMDYPEKYPALTQPEPGYHGKVFAEAFGPLALTFHNHAVGLRDLGPNQQPMNAWLTMMGMETLALRMERHCANALKVAKFLESHEKVAWVNYSGLESSPFHALQQKYMPKGAGAVFTFGLKGGLEEGKKVVESVKLFSHLANIGDTRSLIIHPASTTHSQLSEDKLVAAGAGPDVLRLSIGIECVHDLIADLTQALEQV